MEKSLAELSQDVASKGLGLIYELGSEHDQQELVTTLVDTLMTGKRYGELRTQCKSILSYVSGGNKNVPLFPMKGDVLGPRASQCPFTESQTETFLKSA